MGKNTKHPNANEQMEIIECYNHLQSINATAIVKKRSWSCVKNIITRYKETGEMFRRTGSSRPRITKDQEDRDII